jgi:hypothetical protein
VVIENLDSRERTTVDCDTVAFTGDWIPDHELARIGGLEIDPATRGPVVDAGLRTSSPGVFAVGNLLHPVDTADGAALDGRHVATTVSRWLQRREEPHKAVRIRAEVPFRWVAPQLVSPDSGVAAVWRDVVLGRRVPSAADAAGNAGRPRAQYETHPVARRAGPGVQGPMVAGGECRPGRRRRDRVIRLTSGPSVGLKHAFHAKV